MLYDIGYTQEQRNWAQDLVFLWMSTEKTLVPYQMTKSLNLGQGPNDGQYNPKIVSAIKMI